MEKYRKYLIYGPAIGLLLGAIIGLIFGVITNQRISSEMFYGALIGTITGWGFRSHYEKSFKSSDNKNNDPVE